MMDLDDVGRYLPKPDAPKPSAPPVPRRAPARSGAAIARRSDLARHQPTLERLVAAFLLLISLGGSVLFGGGTDDWLAMSPNWIGAVVALVVQVAVSFGQWVYADNTAPWYSVLVLVSTGMTVAGYWPLVHPWLTMQVTAFTTGGAIAVYAAWIAGALIAVFAIVVDIVPERILLR